MNNTVSYLDTQEELYTLIGLIIEKVELRNGSSVEGEHQGEYSAYELLIWTDRGLIRFTGCHDGGGYDIELYPEILSGTYPTYSHTGGES